ncbi:MAG: hypothetical protein ACKOEH_07880, partial [Actinomycetota bacterium]
MSTSKEQILIERRYAAVLASISDQVLADLAVALPEKLRDPFAKVAGLPAGALEKKADLGSAIRAGVVTRKSFINAGVLLSEPCTEFCIEDLGSAASMPNFSMALGNVDLRCSTFGSSAALPKSSMQNS